MIDVSDQKYDVCRKYIENRHNQHVDWEYIRHMATKASDATQRNLLNQLEDKEYDGWPHMDVEEWFEVFDAIKSQIEDFENNGMDGWSGICAGGRPNLDMTSVYDDPNSCWNRYKYKLLNIAKFSANTVKSLETGCDWIVKRLSPDSSDCIKGMVVGNVQSGKTANMAGVIAMAADLGYNFFIVLSGTIKNLKEQTAKRLYADLALIDKKADPKLKMDWRVLNNPSPKSPVADRLSSLKLSSMINGDSNRNRYLTVCLKNKKRLRDLLGWLQMQDSLINTGLLKVVIIDDECDQAGVNTADVSSDEQTRIFQLIKGLCDHAKPAPKDAVKAGERYQTANYIAYSATPYANILNDGDEKTSLFPRDFICTLPVSLSYWGPSRFFGGSGMYSGGFSNFPFVNEIPVNEIELIRDIHANITKKIPASCKDALIWFICASAVRRATGSKSPVSMLVHTSNKTADHSSIAASIETYLFELNKRIVADLDNVYSEVRTVYEEQAATLTADDFADQFPDYESKNGAAVGALPKFCDIWDGIKSILSEKVAKIKMADEGAVQTFDFAKGIHLCIDNSASNGIHSNENGDDFILRIKYPEKELDFAPLFVIVGGNTLSRGLTLEGLVCSYFLRTVRQSDSLMQMGRWFGYRFGYELLPRVWLSEDTLAKFCLLNAVDIDLRRSLTEAMEAGFPPDQMIPCIRDTSAVINGFTLTSPNKMQMAEIAEADFGGRQMVSVTYDIADESLKSNEAAVVDFLSSLSSFKKASSLAPSNYYVPDVEWATVKAFLEKCSFSAEGRDFKQPELLWSYISKKLDGKKWTVVVAGTAVSKDGSNAFQFSPGLEVGKVGRKINKNGGSYVAFKHVTAPVDFVCDIDHTHDCIQGTPPFISQGIKCSIGQYRSRASLHGKDQIPLLIINCLSKEYLNLKCGTALSRDLYGIAFYFPKTGTDAIGSYTKLRVSNLVADDSSESEV